MSNFGRNGRKDVEIPSLQCWKFIFQNPQFIRRDFLKRRFCKKSAGERPIPTNKSGELVLLIFMKQTSLSFSKSSSTVRTQTNSVMEIEEAKSSIQLAESDTGTQTNNNPSSDLVPENYRDFVKARQKSTHGFMHHICLKELETTAAYVRTM